MGEQVAARFLKKVFIAFVGTKQVWQYGSGRCTLKTAHRKFFLKEKRHQISMIRKEFLYNCSATLDYGCGASFISIRLSAI